VVLKTFLQRYERGDTFELIAADTELKIKTSDLGFIENGMLDEPLNKNALKLEPGKFSGIIQTKFGYHLLYCYKSQPGGVAPLNDSLKKEIYQLISRQRIKKQLDTVIEDYKKENKYELYYNNLNSLDEKKKN